MKAVAVDTILTKTQAIASNAHGAAMMAPIVKKMNARIRPNIVMLTLDLTANLNAKRINILGMVPARLALNVLLDRKN